MNQILEEVSSKTIKEVCDQCRRAINPCELNYKE